MPSRSRRRRTLAGVVIAALACSAIHAAEPLEMRVESEIFVDRGTTPVARSLTVFRAGLAWDFLDGPAPGQTGEIVLHDPARERVVVIDPRRNVKTEIDRLRLDRLSASLAAWARRSDDKLVRWAGGPGFAEGCRVEDHTLELAGPRARYTVEFAPAPAPEASETYRRFADTALLLKALLHPGGIPPFPRLAINERIAAAGGIPETVSLEIDARSVLLGGRSQTLRSVHKVHPRLLAADLERVEDAEARVAVAEAVDLATYAEPQVAAPLSAANESPR
ncbi:hypothetical protein EBR56_03280 [bacterium]|nr:hypothetical protein [bacterium]